MIARWAVILAQAACLLPLAAQSGAKNGEWRTYGGDLGSTRYSPLDQINAGNFNKLEVAWRFKTDSLGPRPDSCRGAASPRFPSFSLCIQISSPVPASSATMARRDPAVQYTMPPTISGVLS